MKRSSPHSSPKVVIVMPAFNAEMTLEDTFREIPKKFLKHIILVDDKSTDRTVKVAAKLKIKVIKHAQNAGYGANQKTCYTAALKLKPDIVAMLHPDYQYSAEYLSELIEPIVRGRYDFMFGSRIATRRGALEGGMPKLKYFTNRFFAVLQNILLGVNFTEHFSGFRAYSAELLKTVPFERFSNDFLFDQHMTLSALSYGFRIGEIPIPTRYDEKSSQMSLKKGIKFVAETFGLLSVYILHQLGVIKSRLFAPPT
jgi:glycosyltransferase involved in cell wall biosynthesis